MIVGHQKQRQILKAAFLSGKIPHAFIFSGQKQLGKKKIALEFIKMIICQERKNGTESCGVCRSCTDIEKNNHPDLLLIDSESKEITVSQIRDAIWKMSLKPYCSDKKFLIIDNAHLMNSEAQNCFLKTLEEPKGEAVIILISDYPGALIPTISSRSQHIKFFPVSALEIKNHLIELGGLKEEADYISRISFGRPGRAVSFLKDKSEIKEQERIISDIIKIGNSDLSFRFEYAKSLAETAKEQSSLKIKEFLDIISGYFRKLLVSKIKNDGLEQGFKERGPKKIKEIISSVQSTAYLISTTNANLRLSLEILFMEM